MDQAINEIRNIIISRHISDDRDAVHTAIVAATDVLHQRGYEAAIEFARHVDIK